MDLVAHLRYRVDHQVNLRDVTVFEKHKTEKEAKEHQAALALWTDQSQTLSGLQYLVLHGGGPGGGGPSDVDLALKKGERSVYLLRGGGLFEPQRDPGHYKGKSQGFSFPIGDTGVRYRIGQSRGTYVQGAETQTIIDHGTVVMTTQRVVFIGTKRTVEWAFSKLIAIQHYSDKPWTAVQVSNRQKVTGITYTAATSENLRLRLEAAVALFNNDTAELQAQLNAAITAHNAAEPKAPIPAPTGVAAVVPATPPPRPADHREVRAPAPPTPSPATPVPRERPVSVPLLTPPAPVPGWYPDPTRRHEYRFWDGSRWTDAVASGGTQTVDAV